jgi:hypothetical protein
MTLGRGRLGLARESLAMERDALAASKKGFMASLPVQALTLGLGYQESQAKRKEAGVQRAHTEAELRTGYDHILRTQGHDAAMAYYLRNREALRGAGIQSAGLAPPY